MACDQRLLEVPYLSPCPPPPRGQPPIPPRTNRHPKFPRPIPSSTAPIRVPPPHTSAACTSRGAPRSTPQGHRKEGPILWTTPLASSPVVPSKMKRLFIGISLRSMILITWGREGGGEGGGYEEMIHRDLMILITSGVGGGVGGWGTGGGR